MTFSNSSPTLIRRSCHVSNKPLMFERGQMLLQHVAELFIGVRIGNEDFGHSGSCPVLLMSKDAILILPSNGALLVFDEGRPRAEDYHLLQLLFGSN